MGTYGYVGEEIACTVNGGTTLRPYSYNLTNGANKIEARAFPDAPGFTPVLLSNRFEDLSLSFRLDAYTDSGLEIDDLATISITLSGVALVNNTYKVTDRAANGTADGIADFTVNFRAVSANA